MAEEEKESYDEKYQRMLEENRQRRRRGRLIFKAKDVKFDYWEPRQHEGTYLIDPETGFDTRTMRCHLGRVKAGTHSEAHRHTNEAIIRIIKGRGYSIIEGERVDWEEGDVMLIPTLAWHQHFNLDPKEDAIYYAVTTVPLMQHLGMFRIDYPWTVGEEDQPPGYVP